MLTTVKRNVPRPGGQVLAVNVDTSSSRRRGSPLILRNAGSASKRPKKLVRKPRTRRIQGQGRELLLATASLFSTFRKPGMSCSDAGVLLIRKIGLCQLRTVGSRIPMIRMSLSFGNSHVTALVKQHLCRRRVAVMLEQGREWGQARRASMCM